MKHTLIFDIGKTHKKVFIFDSTYQEVFKDYVSFAELKDEEGFPCDDLEGIRKWILKTIQTLFKDEQYNIYAINFATYGASLVHLDARGNPLTPLYNYLKPIPSTTLDSFYKKYGDRFTFAEKTASPPLGMLNSGLQLYWLKHTRPKTFEKIRWTLHFPQYLSFLLTGIPVSEYTSLGCHTALWDFVKREYSDWVFEEEMNVILPAIAPTRTGINTQIYGKNVEIGMGIHDSSSALLPYIRRNYKPFLLISTGTWSVSLNPFNSEPLTAAELEQDCLLFMQPNGNPTKAARLFLGADHEGQLAQLEAFFHIEKNTFQQMAFDEILFKKIKKRASGYFVFQHLKTPWIQPSSSQFNEFSTFEEAYHQLMWELVQLQITSTKLAIGNTSISTLFIDGGFSNNDLFVNMLALHFSEIKISTTNSPNGSALGAAMVIT